MAAFDPALFDAPAIPSSSDGFRVEGLQQHLWRYSGQVSARVRLNLPADTVTPRSHMVLCVRLDQGRFLVDVGFGRLTPTAPLRLDCDDAQTTPHEQFRVRAHEHGTLLQAQVQDVWRDVYTFDFVPQLPIDYIQQNWHTATRPGAIFANNLVACRPTSHGRHTLLNRTLTWRGRDGTEARRMVGDRDALGTTLESVFGLAATESELAVAWDVSGRGDAHTPVFS